MCSKQSIQFLPVSNNRHVDRIQPVPAYIYLLCITVTSSERLPSSVCQSNRYKHNIVILQCLETNKHLPGGKIEL